MRGQVAPWLRDALAVWMAQELSAEKDGHTCRGWNALLQGAAKREYGVDLTWSVADRLRRKLVEDLQKCDVPVVCVKRRVRLAQKRSDFEDVVKKHKHVALAHLAAVKRLTGAENREVLREMEREWLTQEEQTAKVQP